MRAWLLAVTAALVAGCGSSTDTTKFGGPGACGMRSGQYQVHFVAHSGNTCPPQSDAIVSLDSLTLSQLMSSCTTASPVDLTSCTVQSHSICDAPQVGAGDKVEETATVNWSPDSSQAMGTIQLNVSNASGQTICSGIYDISYSHL